MRSRNRRSRPAQLLAAVRQRTWEPVTYTVLSAATILLLATAAPAISQEVEGFVYSANEYGNSVSAVDLRDGTVETAPLPISAHNVQITEKGQLLAVGNPVAEKQEEGGAHGGGDGAHGAGGEPGLLVVLDPEALSAGPLASISVGNHPAHVVADAAGARAFVTNSEDDSISVVDLARNELVGTIATGRYPHGLRVSPDGKEAYVAAVDEGAVSVVDMETLTEVARIPVGAAPVQVGFLPDGSRAYVSLRDENRVAVIDTASRKKLDVIEVGRNPIQVHATPDGARVYVANQGSEDEPDDTVSVIDVATNKVIETIRTGRGAHGVAVSEDGSRIFVTNIVEGTVSVIDDATRKVVASFETGDGPNGITFRSLAN